MTKILEIPDALGITIQASLAENNPDLEVGFLILVVAHGQPLQSMSNLDEPAQLFLTGLASEAIAAGMNVSTLLNPEGNA